MTQKKPILPIVTDIIKDALQKNAKQFLKDWTLYTILAWLLAAAFSSISLFLILAIYHLVSNQILMIEPHQNMGVVLFVAAIFGETMGIRQWRVLRRYIPKASGWIVVTNLGWVIGSVMGVSLFKSDWLYDQFIPFMICVSFCLSLTQCLWLKRYSRYWQEWIGWIPLTLITVIVALVGLGGIGRLGGIGFFIGIAWLAFVQGTIPGLYLIFLLRDYWR